MTLGKSTFRLEMWAFTISGGIAAPAGSMYACWMAFIDPTDFNLNMSVFALVMVIIGGAGSVAGPIVGASIVTVLAELIRLFPVAVPNIEQAAPHIIRQGTANIEQIVYGAALVLLMIWRPQGIFGEYRLD